MHYYSVTFLAGKCTYVGLTISVYSMFLLSCCRRAYGSWFHISNLVFYMVFLALFTVLVTTCTFSFEDVSSDGNNITTTDRPGNYSDNTAHISSCRVSLVISYISYVIENTKFCNFVYVF